MLDVYDVTADCKAPVLQSARTTSAARATPAASRRTGPSTTRRRCTRRTVYAVDLTDPANPSVITSDFERRRTHDLFVGKNGDARLLRLFASSSGFGTGSLAIVDTSQVQARAANAEGTLIQRADLAGRQQRRSTRSRSPTAAGTTW